MRRSFRLLLAALSLLLACAVSTRAQFSVTGSSPASVRWKKIETPNFRIVYPSQLDSLALVYGNELEKARSMVSLSSGLTIGQSYRKKMPVVLHPFTSAANGSVAWAPRRMDLLTVPDAYCPTPLPWTKELALHEGRHAAQMQFGASGIFKPFHYLVGEMFAGALAGIYPGPTFLEGDAVASETALSESGRGRQASFLNYFMPAFDCGDWRDYWQWSSGSQKLYSPDFYRTGYLLVAGTRAFFGEPLFVQDYFERAMRGGGMLNLQKTVKEATGLRFKDAFRTIEEGFHGIWFSEALIRGPFMPSEQVSPKPKRHSDYSLADISSDSGIFAIKRGLAEPGKLVFLEYDGRERCLRPFAALAGKLYADSSHNKVYWTETVPHWRWTMKSESRIRYIETSKPHKIHNLTKRGKLFNSRPSPDGSFLCAIDYPITGGSRLELLSSSDGRTVEMLIAPDSLQFIEPLWMRSDRASAPVRGHRLFVSGLSENGIGIYEVFGRKPDGKADLGTVLDPSPVDLCDLGVWPQGDLISFICDRTGVKELYTLDPASSEVRQMTSTRYGIENPVLDTAADTLFYTSVASSHEPQTYRQGKMVYVTSVNDLPSRTVDFRQRHHHLVADLLSEQEKALARRLHQESGSLDGTTSDQAGLSKERLDHQACLSTPEKHSRLRLPNIHSWAPLYFNYDNVEALSLDEYYKTASLGATALFQNLLGDSYGFIGYSLHKDPYVKGNWRHSGHLKYSYSGLLPVLEFSADLNDRDRMEIIRVHETKDGNVSLYSRGSNDGVPYLNASVKAYVPIQLGSGGVSRGIVPQVRYTFTNDKYNDAVEFVEKVDAQEEETKGTTGLSERDIADIRGTTAESFLRTLALSVRGYASLPIAPSQIYPSLGIGAELGWLSRPGHKSAFSDAAYIYTYGYLPGIIPQHGIKLTATFETNLGKIGDYAFPLSAVSTLPRGFVESNLQRILNLCSTSKLKASFDYALPVFPVDWSFLSPAAYIRNFELIPFCDFSLYRFNDNPELHINQDSLSDERLFSVGLDFNVRLGNLLWLPYKTRIGIRYARNFWKGLDLLPVSGLGRDYFGLLYSMDL